MNAIFEPLPPFQVSTRHAPDHVLSKLAEATSNNYVLSLTETGKKYFGTISKNSFDIYPSKSLVWIVFPFQMFPAIHLEGSISATSTGSALTVKIHTTRFTRVISTLLFALTLLVPIIMFFVDSKTTAGRSGDNLKGAILLGAIFAFVSIWYLFIYTKSEAKKAKTDLVNNVITL